MLDILLLGIANMAVASLGGAALKRRSSEVDRKVAEGYDYDRIAPQPGSTILDRLPIKKKEADPKELLEALAKLEPATLSQAAIDAGVAKKNKKSIVGNLVKKITVRLKTKKKANPSKPAPIPPTEPVESAEQPESDSVSAEDQLEQDGIETPEVQADDLTSPKDLDDQAPEMDSSDSNSDDGSKVAVQAIDLDKKAEEAESEENNTTAEATAETEIEAQSEQDPSTLREEQQPPNPGILPPEAELPAQEDGQISGIDQLPQSAADPELPDPAEQIAEADSTNLEEAENPIAEAPDTETPSDEQQVEEEAEALDSEMVSDSEPELSGEADQPVEEPFLSDGNEDANEEDNVETDVEVSADVEVELKEEEETEESESEDGEPESENQNDSPNGELEEQSQEPESEETVQQTISDDLQAAVLESSQESEGEEEKDGLSAEQPDPESEVEPAEQNGKEHSEVEVSVEVSIDEDENDSNNSDFLSAMEDKQVESESESETEQPQETESAEEPAAESEEVMDDAFMEDLFPGSIQEGMYCPLAAKGDYLDQIAAIDLKIRQLVEDEHSCDPEDVEISATKLQDANDNWLEFHQTIQDLLKDDKMIVHHGDLCQRAETDLENLKNTVQGCQQYVSELLDQDAFSSHPDLERQTLIDLRNQIIDVATRSHRLRDGLRHVVPDSTFPAIWQNHLDQLDHYSEGLEGLQNVFAQFKGHPEFGGQPAEIGLVEVQGVQGVNSDHGLAYGDKVLAECSNAIYFSVRHNRDFDRIVRISGNQFAIFFGLASGHAGKYALERIRQNFEATRFQIHDQNIKVDCCCSTMSWDPEQGSDFHFQKLLMAVEQGIENGGNRVMIYDADDKIKQACELPNYEPEQKTIEVRFDETTV